MKTKKKSKLLTKKTKRLLFIWGMLAYPLIQYLIFFIYVNIDSVLMAFQSMNMQTGETYWSTNNFQRFIHEWTDLPQMRVAVRNSLIGGVSNIVIILLALTLAYFFYRKMPGRMFFRVVYFLPSIISIVIYTMAYKFMFDTSVGPINILLSRLGVSAENLPTWFGDTDLAFPLIVLYCIWVGVGYNILLYGSAMENLPEDVMEYSRMEGVSRTRELFQIVIPMIWPTIGVSLLGTISTIFTLFIQVELLTQGGPNGASATIAYLINGVVKSSSANLEWGATMGLCFTIIAAPFFILMKKMIDKVGEHFGV